ncbi:WecB/TagA/CpsF family glycosyltransferase [Brevundimonas lutea]|nr:WecB/TagA/CpsF family glycosyltransferase [Brevundimonas lutea]
MDAPQRLRLLGGEVDLMSQDQLFDRFERAISNARSGGAATIVANHNLHSLKLIAHDREMARFYARAEAVQIDSMPLVAWGRLLGRPTEPAHRHTYLDWRDRFWRSAAGKGWRVFHLGCAPGVGEAALDAVRTRHPGVEATSHHGFFNSEGEENAAVVHAITEARPDILMVGMGMPRQERWILDNLDVLPPCLILPIGGALAYEAGVVSTAPRWTGRLGVEWLWRFATEPHRLFHRYFIEPWALAPQALADLRRRA